MNTTSSDTVMEPMQVLWTGGWDSSSRVLELLFQYQVAVQTHYIVNPERKSVRHELRAMDRIRSGVERARPDLAPLLLPTKFALMAEIQPNPEITRLWEQVRSVFVFANQYEWITRYMLQHGIDNLELGVHGDDTQPQHERMRYLVEPYTTPSGVPSYRFPPGVELGELVLFGPFSYPLLWRTKREMGEMASQHGYRDLLELSWFCHYPVGDNPCGMCLPCRDAYRDGMKHRLTTAAKLRRPLWAPVQAFRVARDNRSSAIDRARERLKWRDFR